MRRHEAASRPDGHAIRSQRTRARILAESLQLFNAQGEARVTTQMIAEAAGISPGNLHYHFRTREAILGAHFDDLERATFEPPPARGGPEALEDLWLSIHLLLEALHRYRFLYRDPQALPQRDRHMAQRLRRLLDRQRAALEGLCTQLARSGLLRADAQQVVTLASNVLVVAIFWPSYDAATHSAGDAERAVGRGAYQVLSLFAPHFEGRAREHLERLARRYLD